jgi:hypothetical protein
LAALGVHLPGGLRGAIVGLHRIGIDLARCEPADELREFCGFEHAAGLRHDNVALHHRHVVKKVAVGETIFSGKPDLLK